MKPVVAIAAAALLLLAVLLLRRRTEEPGPRRPPPAPAPPAAPAAPPAAELLPAAPRELPSTPSSAGSASLLDDLLHAARQGDEKKLRGLLERLRAQLLPPVPDEENAALLIEKAFGLLPGPMPPRDVGRKGFEALLLGRTPSPEDLAELRAWFQSNKDVLADVTRLLQDAAGRPRSRFTQDPAGTLGLPLPTLVRAQSSSNLLLVQASLLRLDGRRDEAAGLLGASFAIARALREEPSFTAQMIACAVETLTWEAIQRERILDAPVLAAHAAALDPRALPLAVERSLLGEAYLLARASTDPSKTAAELQCLRDIQGLSAGRYEDMRLPLEALSKTAAGAAAGGSMPFTLRIMVSSEIRLSILQAASAVEAYRSRRGVYPETLAALEVAVPLDPSSGRPFAYRREGDGYVLDVTGEIPLKQRLVWRSSR